jgi:hypothetical protein
MDPIAKIGEEEGASKIQNPESKIEDRGFVSDGSNSPSPLPTRP